MAGKCYIYLSKGKLFNQTLLILQMICNNRNKGSVTRQTDFGCTPLSDIFRGELRSRLQREGEHPTDVIQPFLTLPLNIEVC